MAFLLLVFFLLVTRISDDTGLRVDLPAIEPSGDATLVLERDFQGEAQRGWNAARGGANS